MRLKTGIIMPSIKDLAEEILGQDCAVSLNLGSLSVNEFLQNFQKMKVDLKTGGNIQALLLLRCAVLARYRPLVRSGQYLCQKALESSVVLTTGCSYSDKLMNGGIYTNEVVEVYGRSGLGKTQLALHVTTLACVRHHCNVIYADTTSSFTSRRVMEILTKNGTTEEVASRVLKKILVVPCFDIFQLQNLIHTTIQSKKNKAEDIYSKVKLLVIDSIYSLLSPVLSYKSHEGYNAANSLASSLRKLARENYVAVLMLNGTVTGETTSGLPKAALGVQWHQTADRRLLMLGYDDTAPNLFNIKLV